jgi:hypothetical protein
MDRLIPLSSLTKDAIVRETHKEALAELYALQNVIESQAWHDDQSVFDHSLASMDALDTILMFDFTTPQARQNLQAYLETPLETHSKKELLRLATLLHDIGKNISLQTKASGDTSSPSHGVIGGWVAAPLLKRLALTKKEQNYILHLITTHLLPSDLIELEVNGALESRESLQLLAMHEPEHTIELVLLAYADWMGCAIRAAAHEEREKRVMLVQSLLEKANAKATGF